MQGSVMFQTYCQLLKNVLTLQSKPKIIFQYHLLTEAFFSVKVFLFISSVSRAYPRVGSISTQIVIHCGLHYAAICCAFGNFPVPVGIICNVLFSMHFKLFVLFTITVNMETSFYLAEGKHFPV